MKNFILWLAFASLGSAQTIVSTGNHREIFPPAGNTNHARQFNGTSNALQSASAIPAASSAQWSLSFDMYWNAFANDDKLAFETSANHNSVKGAWIVDPNSSDASTPSLFEWDIEFAAAPSFYWYCGIPRPSAAAWHHYVLTMDTSSGSSVTCTAYVDGTSQAITSGRIGSGPVAITPTSQVLNVMSRNAASLFGAGRMSSIAYYNGIVNSTDASSLASCGRPTSVSSATLIAYWPINQTSPEVPTTGAVNLNVTGTTNVASVCSF